MDKLQKLWHQYWRLEDYSLAFYCDKYRNEYIAMRTEMKRILKIIKKIENDNKIPWQKEGF